MAKATSTPTPSEAAQWSAYGDVLTSCAVAIETAVVQVIGIVLPNGQQDNEVQAIRKSLLDHAHRLRQVGTDLQQQGVGAAAGAGS